MFFNVTATTEICTLTLHDALPIFLPTVVAGLHPHPEARRVVLVSEREAAGRRFGAGRQGLRPGRAGDRETTSLDSSDANIFYIVFALQENSGILASNVDVLTVKRS